MKRLIVMTPKTGVSSVAENLPGILDDLSSNPDISNKYSPNTAVNLPRNVCHWSYNS